MFTLNHNVLFPERMFSSQFSIVGGNKINQLLFVWWVGGEGGVFSSSSELLLSVSFGWWTLVNQLDRISVWHEIFAAVHLWEKNASQLENYCSKTNSTLYVDISRTSLVRCPHSLGCVHYVYYRAGGGGGRLFFKGAKFLRSFWQHTEFFWQLLPLFWLKENNYAPPTPSLDEGSICHSYRQYDEMVQKLNVKK